MLDTTPWQRGDYINFYTQVWNASLFPLHKENSKAPIIPWAVYQTRPPTKDELEGWFEKERAWGISLICGAISGNLWGLDIDDDDEYERLRRAGAFAQGSCIMKSRRGYHVLMKSDTIPVTIAEVKHAFAPEFWQIGVMGNNTPCVLPDTPQRYWIELHAEPVVVNQRAWLKRYLDYDIEERNQRREITIQCPYHEDTHPSCCVNKDKGVFYCHGCKAKGKVGELIAELTRLGRGIPRELDDHLRTIGGRLLRRMPWGTVVPEASDVPLVEGLLPNGENAKLLIIGPPKIGKTTLALSIAIPMARGERALQGLSVARALRVAYCNFEQYGNSIITQINKMVQVYGEPPGDMFYIVPARGLKLNKKEDSGALLTVLTEEPQVEVVILDGLHQALENMNDRQQVSAMLEFLDELVDKVRCAVILLHHTAVPIALGIGQSYDSAVGMMGKRLERWVGSRLYYTNIPHCTVEYYGRVKGEVRGGIGLVDYAVAYNMFSDSVSLVEWRDVPMEEGYGEKMVGAVSQHSRVVQQLCIYWRALGYKLEALATTLGVDKSTVSRWYHGKMSPGEEHWGAIKELIESLQIKNKSKTASAPGTHQGRTKDAPGTQPHATFSKEEIQETAKKEPQQSCEESVMPPLNTRLPVPVMLTLPVPVTITPFNNNIINHSKSPKEAREAGATDIAFLPYCGECPAKGCPRVEGTGEIGGIMLIGEAPAEEEVKRGKPFVGRAGEFLGDLLRLAGIDRAECYITNTCLCYRGEKEKKILTPTSKMIKACLPRLLGDIERVKPKSIWLLGEIPTSALLPECGVGRYHGKRLIRGGMEYVVMYHPSAGLRNPFYKQALLTDFEAIKNAPLVEEIDGDYKLGAVSDYALLVKRVELVAIDTETIGFEGKLLGGAVCVAPGEARYFVGADLIRYLKSRPDWQRLLFHNAKFDLKVLEVEGFEWRDKDIDDTMLLAYCMSYPTLGLKVLETQELNLEHPDYAEVTSELTTEKVARYCCQDADSTRRLWDYLWREADDRERRIYTNIEKPLLPVLMDVERKGIRVDLEYTREWQANLIKERDAVGQLLESEFGITPTTLSSSLQLGNWLVAQGVDLPKTSRSEQYTTSKYALAGYMDTHPAIPLILKHRQFDKLERTYASAYLKLADEKGIIHSTFHQSRVVTGRLSSSGPNLQNLPHKFEARRPFIASPGCKLVSCDFSQIDMRAMAAVTGDKTMIKAYQDKRMDIHNWLADRLFGDHEPRQRYVAKSANYLAMYGGSARGLRGYLNAPMGEFDLERMGSLPSYKECERIIVDFYGLLKGLGDWQARTKKHVTEHLWVEDYFGRRRYIHKVLSSSREMRDEGFREAINFPIAGTAAELFKLSMICTGAIWTPSINIHDELVFDIPEDRVDQLVPQLVAAMEGIDFPVSLVVKYKVGDNLGDLL